MNEELSVLMTTFNCPSLRESLRSLEQQTYKNFEVILINDGGDSVETIVVQFPTLKVKLFELKKNNGLSFALNFGLKKCNGKFIARMDSDDICMPNRFEKQLPTYVLKT